MASTMRVATMYVRFCSECPHWGAVSGIENPNSGFCLHDDFPSEGMYTHGNTRIMPGCPLPKLEGAR
jgi:hypothetical protein